MGITSTTDRKDATNIVDYVGYKTRIFHVGRLDKDSEGLILLTNDGDIVNKILRTEHNHEKEYIVTVDKPITKDFVKQMAKGVPILDTVTKRCKVIQRNKYTFRIVLTEGLNRQIRRMCSHFGYKVTHLKRVRIMHIIDNALPTGKWRHLTEDERTKLLQATA
jgi:23S rRNA pseudouridine2604 synthase